VNDRTGATISNAVDAQSRRGSRRITLPGPIHSTSNPDHPGAADTVPAGASAAGDTRPKFITSHTRTNEYTLDNYNRHCPTRWTT
jgi:hypothetical protein